MLREERGRTITRSKMFIEHLLHAGHYAGGWEHSDEENPTDSMSGSKNLPGESSTNK